MPVISKHYNNSTSGELVLHMYSTEIKGSDAFFKNGKKWEDGNLNGCVPIKEKNYERELKNIKKGRQ